MRSEQAWLMTLLLARRRYCRESVGSADQGGSFEFVSVLATPGVATDAQALLQAAGGDEALAEAAAVYLSSRYGSR